MGEPLLSLVMTWFRNALFLQLVCQFSFETPVLVMPLRSSRFYLFGFLHYYGHIRLPRSRTRRICRGSHVLVLPSLSRNHILPRVSAAVLFTVYPNSVAGFGIFERLANTLSVTRLDCSSLRDRSTELSISLLPPVYLGFSSI